MDWVQTNSPKTIKAVGLQFDSGWNIGAVALTKGQFTLMTTEDLSLLGNHITRQQMIADGEEIDPDEEYEFEWSDVRDEVQLSFIHHIAQTGTAKPGFPIWVRPTRCSVPQNRPPRNPVSFGNDGHADTIGLRGDWLPSHPILPFVPCCGRTRPVAGEHRRGAVDHVGAGSGLSRSMRRRMSANRSRGMATSAIWNVT